jgi:hypothetical protein
MTYLLGRGDRDWRKLERNNRYLHRGPEFAKLLPMDMRGPHMVGPRMLRDSKQTLPLRQYAPDWVSNRYVHTALCHDPRKAPNPGYLPQLTHEEQFYLGAAHAALLGHVLPEDLHEPATRTYRRWLGKLGTWVWMYDPLVQVGGGGPGDLPGTPWDDMRYQNVHATQQVMRAAIRAVTGKDAPENPDLWVDAIAPYVLQLHRPKELGDERYASQRTLPMHSPTYLAPYARKAPPTKRRRRKKRKKRKPTKPGLTGAEMTRQLRERREARKKKGRTNPPQTEGAGQHG